MFSLLNDCQKAAETVVMQAMLSLMRYRKAHKFIPFWKKPDQTYVTPADYAIQYYFYQKLTSLFPHIPLVGEETLNPATDHPRIPQILQFAQQLDPKVSCQDLYQALSPESSHSSLFWLTDPIDGTSGFIKQRCFAIALSLFYEHTPVLSVIACPSSKNNSFKIYSAAKGEGLTICNPTHSFPFSLHEDFQPTCKFCEASLSARNHQHLATHILSKHLPWNPQPIRADSQCKYAWVADNTVDFFIRIPYSPPRAHYRDHAPGVFLIEEAGGLVTDISGNPLPFSNPNLYLDRHPLILASANEQMHSTILETLYKLRHQATQNMLPLAAHVSATKHKQLSALQL
ncbi:inositol monophosphatase family protein [Chlamydia trachomatis]|uniref:inositol monophosphatase family protein n=1 Tax=Chlamydia trachomatis TaxID=813 RepID=UPI0001B46E42|nr:inositol monophosphatase family protein [Chlamydia trachomatis]ADH17575.1 3'(2'),5'-bisphosphate nucleotidase [Chlamydia trachomatis E/150]ADH21267.1 3'(2'),5'-bisphosphate nucleotidase [Chlamydia trachomatis E/11023]AGT64743.1 3'-5'-bisphosphate nucleotidase [Chlamydia trachomatis]AGT65673.1 3'-5'-bisphosphate nucleotidase [Chlamydia trachomatis]AGT66599.1 3'-5'-bisphosphate nucleotidase [Chlamydia trachomatis]